MKTIQIIIRNILWLLAPIIATIFVSFISGEETELSNYIFSLTGFWLIYIIYVILIIINLFRRANNGTL